MTEGPVWGAGELPPGSQVAGYQVEELVGRGGMAVVYRAVDVRLGRQVALKVLAPELALDQAFRRRFIRESRAGAAVDHPNVIPVFEAGEAGGVLFIAMRYVSGQDVRALIGREGRLPAWRAVSIISQIASALDAAHSRGLVHRDVKPANMLLGSAATGSMPDHVYLSDFGLSKVSLASASLTGTGQFLGTLDYMAPEQIEGRPVDGRTDLYALGCAAFEMLAGEPPFRRQEDMAVMWAQVSAPPPSLVQRRPDLPPAVDEVIAAALAKAPADRPASCLQFAERLRAACGLQGRPAPPAADAPPHPPTELARAAAGAPPGAGTGPDPPRQQPTMTDMPAVASSGGGPGAAGQAPPGYPAPGGPGAASPPPPGYPPSGGLAASPGGPPGSGFQGQYQDPQNPFGPGGSWFREPGARSDGQPPSGAGPGFPAGRTPSGPPGWQPGSKRRGRTAGAVLAGFLVVIIIAGAAIAVLRLRGNGGSGQPGHAQSPASTTGSGGPTRSGGLTPSGGRSGTASARPPLTTPGSVVEAYFNAINQRDYRTAWRLGGDHTGQTYDQFRAGFATTMHDTLSVGQTTGDVVSVRLTAQQTDGTTKTFAGTYTVRGGVIVSSNITQTS